MTPTALTPRAADRLRRRRPIRGVPRLALRIYERSAVVGRGAADHERAADILLAWGVQEHAGLRVVASSPQVEVGGIVRQGFGRGLLTLWAPCEVTDVRRSVDGVAFTYRTLAGHPELGHETFALTLDADGRVWFRVTAVSRPGTWLTVIGLPVMRVVQHRIIDRYLRAFDR